MTFHVVECLASPPIRRFVPSHFFLRAIGPGGCTKELSKGIKQKTTVFWFLDQISSPKKTFFCFCFYPAIHAMFFLLSMMKCKYYFRLTNSYFRSVWISHFTQNMFISQVCRSPVFSSALLRDHWQPASHPPCEVWIPNKMFIWFMQSFRRSC